MDENELEEIKKRDKFQYEKIGGPDLQCEEDRHNLLIYIKELQEEVETEKELAYEERMGEDL